MTHNVQLHVGELAARLSARARGPRRENADRVEDVERAVAYMENRRHARQTEIAWKTLVHRLCSPSPSPLSLFSL